MSVINSSGTLLFSQKYNNPSSFANTSFGSKGSKVEIKTNVRFSRFPCIWMYINFDIKISFYGERKSSIEHFDT